jgi:hypothetical protein
MSKRPFARSQGRGASRSALPAIAGDGECGRFANRPYFRPVSRIPCPVSRTLPYALRSRNNRSNDFWYWS